MDAIDVLDAAVVQSEREANDEIVLIEGDMFVFAGELYRMAAGARKDRWCVK